MTRTELAERLTLDRHPRSNRYDPAWVIEHMMGPHPLWLMEHLANLVDLEPDQRVMDLGCGKALTFPASRTRSKKSRSAFSALSPWLLEREPMSER